MICPVDDSMSQKSDCVKMLFQMINVDFKKSETASPRLLIPFPNICKLFSPSLWTHILSLTQDTIVFISEMELRAKTD